MYDRAGARLPRATRRLWAAAGIGGLLAAMLMTLGSAPASARSASLDQLEIRIVALINGNRANAGLPPVRVSRRLARSADAHSRDMARRGFFAHDSSSGLDFAARIRRYSRAARFGENLAYVPRALRRGVAERVVGLWMASPPHRAMILSRAFRRIGVARRAGRIGRTRAAIFTADFSSGR
jgi:uncharacterized protein YkwD